MTDDTTNTEQSRGAADCPHERVVIAPLDRSYHQKNLQRILGDLNSYNPDEYARALLRLVCVANPIVMAEPEFTQQRLKAISDAVNAPPVVPDNLAQ